MGNEATTAVVTGIGLVIEEAGRDGWRELDQDLDASSFRAHGRQFELSSGTRRRDDKVLSREDLLSVLAAERAMNDAFPGRPPLERVWGAISFSASKLTLDNEHTQPFIDFRKDDNSPDTVAFRRAIESSQIHIDPLGLLRRLDNNVCWWICKTYGFGGVNLQLGQSLRPDLWGLVAATDLVTSGECDSVLVGGGATTQQSAIQIVGEGGDVRDECDSRVGGGAVFFVLEQARVATAPGYARISLDLDLKLDPREQFGERFSTPSLSTAVEFLRHCLGLRGAAPQIRIGPFLIERTLS